MKNKTRPESDGDVPRILRHPHRFASLDHGGLGEGDIRHDEAGHHDHRHYPHDHNWRVFSAGLWSGPGFMVDIMLGIRTQGYQQTEGVNK